MKLKDYIREGYNIVTSPNLAYKIQEDYPNALVFTDRALDAIPIGKLLVDRFYSNSPAVLRAKPLQNAYAIERERLDESPKGLVDVSYHWKTDGFSNNDRGANDINIEYYSTSNDKYLDKKTIRHKREV